MGGEISIDKIDKEIAGSVITERSSSSSSSTSSKRRYLSDFKAILTKFEGRMCLHLMISLPCHAYVPEVPAPQSCQRWPVLSLGNMERTRAMTDG
jgi:hypothetical protein